MLPEIVQYCCSSLLFVPFYFPFLSLPCDFVMPKTRREFLRSSTAFAVGFAGLQRFVASGEVAARSADIGFGPLLPDPKGLFDLPAGFSYRVISRTGETMDDGLLVPSFPDGMAAFPGPDGQTILIRNHEIEPYQESPFGDNAERLSQIDAGQLYDEGEPGKPCIGGTTTLVYDTKNQKLIKQYLSLSGTMRNCAGGPTPWGTWITCEEAIDVPGRNNLSDVENFCQKHHGYTFEVPASAETKLYKAVPLTAMGRFKHEAIAVDPQSGVVFQTEDVEDGIIYRFIPNRPGELAAGGKLQALALVEHPAADTRNWSDDFNISVGKEYAVRWIDLDEVESPVDDLRYRGFNLGAARFARGEGMWFSDGAVYFACTTGGSAHIGQIWKYTPSPNEGQANEVDAPGKLELFIEPNNSELIANADNLTASPWGDLIVCEDRNKEEEVRLVGVTAEGKCYTLAHYHFRKELAGATFSPDGSTLFVNFQHEGMTVAITGPWPKAEGTGS